MNKLLLLWIGVLFLSVQSKAQQADTIQNRDTGSIKIDSLQPAITADTVVQLKSVKPLFKIQNKFLNINGERVSVSVDFRKKKNTESLFYMIAGFVLLLAFLKYFYHRYFVNLFRVFFNTSLRQSQLTDQLLQAKLPSLLFNIFFIISGGIYAYILLVYYNLITEENRWLMIGASVGVLGIIYFTKFFTLKFTGWVTGLKDITNVYVFIIFLINKIIGIFLVPVIIILAFSESSIIKIAVIFSLMSIGFLLILRFFRSYGILQSQLKISRFHFVIYIVGIEILPLLLIYKALMLYLSKNL